MGDEVTSINGGRLLWRDCKFQGLCYAGKGAVAAMLQKIPHCENKLHPKMSPFPL